MKVWSAVTIVTGTPNATSLDVDAMGMPVTAAPRSASRVWWGRALLSILALWGAFTALSPLTQHLEVVRLLRDD